MHATQLLDTHLIKSCQGIHQKRWKALMTMVTALTRGKKLSVTGLGRSLKNAVYEKHNIKRADRLIGNMNLNQERWMIYQALAKHVIGQQKRPVILIDWSDLSTDRKFNLLRASLPVGGRAITLYDESHPQKKLNNPGVEKQFLTKLSDILPPNCRPIIITDAGYRIPWFRVVASLGWDFIGRVGGHTMMNQRGKASWQRVEEVFKTATTRTRYLGNIDLVRKNPLQCHAYLLKKKKQGRIKKTIYGKRSKMQHSKANAHRARTPWLIATSLEGGASISKRVINLYKTRMQIEEAFRDIKNSRWGFSFDEAKATSKHRYENLLLVGVLATFAIWLTGKVAELKNLQRQYQANTITTRNILSTFYLGCQVLKKEVITFHRDDYSQALIALKQQFREQCFE